VARPDARTGAPPKIVAPADGSVFVLDPDLPGNGSRLLLRAAGSDSVRWTSATLGLTRSNGLDYATLTPGLHELRVTDDATNATSCTRIEVRILGGSQSAVSADCKIAPAAALAE
jgi:penicillin-binding protein 1C